VRQLFISVTQEGLQTGHGWACTIISHPCASSQGTIHRYSRCPFECEGRSGLAQHRESSPVTVELYMFWSDMKGGKWMKTSLISSVSTGRPRSWMPSVHRQDYDMDIVVKLHSCWHRLSLIFDAVHQQHLEKRKQRWDELSWLSRISLHVLSGQRVQSTFTLHVLLITERITGCLGFSANFDLAKGFTFLFTATEHKLACQACWKSTNDLMKSIVHARKLTLVKVGTFSLAHQFQPSLWEVSRCVLAPWSHERKPH